MDSNATTQMDSNATTHAELSQLVRDLNECLVEELQQLISFGREFGMSRR